MITRQSAKAKRKLLEDYIARWIRQLGLDRLAMRQPASGSGQWKGDVNTKLKILGRQLLKPKIKRIYIFRNSGYKQNARRSITASRY